MGVRLYVNSYSTRLTAQLTAGATTANVTAGDGAALAGANGTDFFYGTLRRVTGYKDVAREIVKITNRSTDALTIVRAQESTSALQFEVGDILDIDLTAAGIMRELAYVEYTSPVTVSAATEGASDVVVTAPAITFDGVTPVVIQFFAPYVLTGAGTYIAITLFDNGTTIGYLAYTISNGTTTLTIPVNADRRLTPSAASHAYSIRAFRQANNGSVGAGTGGSGQQPPGFIRIVTA
jgi:hypothetical protein